MKVAKKISVQGEWAKPKQDISDGDIITILNAGQVIQGDYGDRNVFRIKTKNGEKNLSFNQTSMNNLITAYGDETDNWVEKKIKAFVIKVQVSGKLRDVIYLTAPDWKMTDDGEFIPEGEEIQTEDIPF